MSGALRRPPGACGRPGFTRDRQRGQTLVELALVIVLFVTLIVGIVEFGRAWMIANVITHAARDGARTAAVVPAANRDADGFILATGAIRSQVLTQIGGVMDPSSLSVTVQQPTIDGIPMVRVTVGGSVPLLFNLVGSNFDVVRSASFRDEGR